MISASKKNLKQIVRAVMALAVSPLVLAYILLSCLSSKSFVFPGFSQLLSLIPGHFGVYLRWAFYKSVLPICGQDTFIGFGTIISHYQGRIGRGVYIGSNCMLGSVSIGDDTLLGSNVSVINGAKQHGIERLDVPIREQKGEYSAVSIGRDCWIGDKATVLASIGDHCVIGAGSVVTKPIPNFAIAVGNPARVVRLRTDHMGTEKDNHIGITDKVAECVE